MEVGHLEFAQPGHERVVIGEGLLEQGDGPAQVRASWWALGCGDGPGQRATAALAPVGDSPVIHAAACA